MLSWTRHTRGWVEKGGPAAIGTEPKILSAVKDGVTKALFLAEELKHLSHLHTPSSRIKPGTCDTNVHCEDDEVE
jgi:hypothetical protein